MFPGTRKSSQRLFLNAAKIGDAEMIKKLVGTVLSHVIVCCLVGMSMLLVLASALSPHSLS